MTVARFNQAVAAAAGELTFLLRRLAPREELAALSPRARLEAIDAILHAIQPMPDLQLRELYLVEVCEWFAFKRSLIAPRLDGFDKAAHAAAEAARKRDEQRRPQPSGGAGESFEVSSRGGTENAEDSPAGQREWRGADDHDGAEVAGEERDGGLHRHLIHRLECFIATRKIRPDAVGGWMREGGRARISMKHRDLVNDFIFKHASLFVSLPRERVDMTLSAMVMLQREQRRKDILATVTGKAATARGEAMLSLWLKATTGRTDATDLGVMKHFLWQVKRLNTEKTVAWDTMPVFSGPQGTGKSTAIRQLCSPLQELFLSIKAAHLTDDRSFEALSDYAVGFWGEMAGGNKAEIAALKHTITAPDVNYRELGGHNHNLLSRRMAFIADANEDVADIIADTTGARRYYQIDVPSVVDYKLLDLVDPLICWEAISEEDEPPLMLVHDEVKLRQRDLVHQDIFDAWMEAESGRGWPELIIIMEGVPFDQGSGGAAPRIRVSAYRETRKDPDGIPYGYTLEEIGQRFGQYLRLQRLASRTTDWLTKRLHQTGWITVRPQPVPGRHDRPRYFRLPPLAAPPVVPPATGPTRGERLAADPSPAEDRFQAEAAGPGPAIPGPLGSDNDGTHFAGGDDEPPF